MTDHDDTQLDSALEALARPDPPADHVARVLSRTNAERPGSPVDIQGGQLAALLRPRWVLPVAATMLAVLGVTWQIEQQARARLDESIVPDAFSHTSGGTSAWGEPQEVVRPVLPPQAYWGMDPFREFATLRPGTQEHRNTGTQGGRPARQGVASAGQGSDSIVRLSAAALPEAGQSLTARHTAVDDELTWESVPSGLPPIELVSIAPAPLAAAPVAPIEEIALADIPLAPIVIGPITEEERP